MKLFWLLLTGSIIGVFMVEIGLRSFGIQPLDTILEKDNLVCNNGPLFKPSEEFGYVMSTGAKQVVINQQLNFTMTIDEQGFRRSEFTCDTCENALHIYGCSHFAGFGVQDNEVLSSFVQMKMPDTKVLNFSIPGHGLNTQYLQFKSAVRNGTKPANAVFEIASIHLPRNVGAYSFLKNFHTVKSSPNEYIQCYFESSGQLGFRNISVRYRHLPLSQYSSIINLLNGVKEQLEYKESYMLDVELALIDSIQELADRENVEVLFLAITHDPVTKQIENYCNEKAYNFLLSSIDYTKNEYNLYPLDGHPNTLAHTIYANEVTSFDFGIKLNEISIEE